MDISVCIVSWNVRSLLLDCLASLGPALKGLKGEVMVVDNASGDASAQAVSQHYPDYGLISNKKNIGFAAACNQAMKATSGRYILLLNPDTTLASDTLRGMIDFLDRHPQAGGGGVRQLNPDGTLQPSVRSFPSRLTGLEQFTLAGKLFFLRGVRQRYLLPAFDYNSPAQVDQPMGAGLFLSRSYVEEVGWMDEKYFLYYEEVDLCFRLARNGHPMFYNPEVHIVHQGGASTKQVGTLQTAWLISSFLKFIQTRYGLSASRRYLYCFGPLLRARLAIDIITNRIKLLLLKKSSPGWPRAQRKLEKKLKFKKQYLIKVLAGEEVFIDQS